MNKFYNHIFCKIGLLISSCVVDLSQMKAEAQEARVSLWPVNSSETLHNILSKDDVFKSMDSSGFQTASSSSWHDEKQPTASKREKSMNDKLSRPLVFFSLDAGESPADLGQDSSSLQRSETVKALSERAVERERLFHELTSEDELPQNFFKEGAAKPVKKNVVPEYNFEPHQQIAIPNKRLAEPDRPQPLQTATPTAIPEVSVPKEASSPKANTEDPAKENDAAFHKVQKEAKQPVSFENLTEEKGYPEISRPSVREPDPVNQRIVPNKNEQAKIAIPKARMETPAASPPAASLMEKPHLIALDKNTSPEDPAANNQKKTGGQNSKTILINFNNVGIIEFIRFISRISNKNFVFDEADLQFNVTIVSEEPTTIENIMTALLQELRIHGLTLIEQGNNLIIHKNPKVSSISKVVAEDLPGSQAGSAEIITQVFRLNTLEPDRAAAIIRPLVSENAILEFIKDTNHLIVTDLHSNIIEIAKLIKSLDAPNSGLVIGQYVAKSADVQSLVPLVQQIMLPISKDSPLVYVPYTVSQSIFIVSTPFLVERSLSILEHLDQETGKTRILELEKMQFGHPHPHEAVQPTGPTNYQRQLEDENRRLLEQLKGANKTIQEQQEQQPIPVSPYELFPFEQQEIDAKAKELAKSLCPAPPPPPKKVGITEFEEEKPVLTEKILKKVETNESFFPVPVSRSKFYIHKVQYRNGGNLLAQLNQIGTSMQNTTGNDSFISVINSAQFLQDSKALVFTGTPENLEKIKYLVEEMDIPLRQVYIEMLILNTSVDDSLNFSVNWNTEFGGGNYAGAQGFSSDLSLLPGVINAAGTNNLGSITPNVGTGVPFSNAIAPNPSPLISPAGFNLGVIGQHIIHKGLGLQFNSIGALVTALHRRNLLDIILSPKIITEDNVPAQIFVGVTTPFKTQSLSNELGTIITNNFEFRDVGTSLQVTPHIFNSDMVTLEILQERSALVTTPASTGNSNTVIGPTTSKTSTKTTVHVPNGFFVIISGMIETDLTKNKLKVPCLGSMPIVGAAFSDKQDSILKRNLMIFLRPLIIDTDEQFQNLTRHQQDIWQYSNEMPKDWVEEIEGALDYFNVRPTLNTDDQDLPECHKYSH